MNIKGVDTSVTLGGMDLVGTSNTMTPSGLTDFEEESESGIERLRTVTRSTLFHSLD